MDKPTVLNLSEFNVNFVLGHFKLATADRTAADCVRYLYRQAQQDHQATTAQGRIERARAAADITIEKIQYRYDLYTAYADDFFGQGASVNRDAVIMAVMIDDNVHSVNLPIFEPADDGTLRAENDNGDDTPRFTNDGLDVKAVMDATILFDQAVDMQSYGLLDEELLEPETLALMREITFIAHLNTWQHLNDFMKNFGDHEPETLVRMREEDIPAAQVFLDVTTSLGKLLYEHMQIVTQAIDAALDAQKPAAVVTKPRRSPLQLVTPDGP